MNPADLFKVKASWDKFTQNHPKFPMFLSAVRTAEIKEGSVVEVTITTQEGQKLCTNVKLQPSDMDMIDNFKKMAATR